MNYEKFRRTGELSDITVVVDKTEFKLHTFPLFTKSDYFKKAVAASTTSAPYVVRLDNNFPGGAPVFNQLADYFYSIPVTIDHKNVIPLRSAACFIECDTLGTILDKRVDEILLVARAKYDLGIPLALLEQCVGEYQQWTKQVHIVDKCLESIVESLIRGAGLQLSKSDRETLIRLPLEWIIELINLCPTESKLAVLPLAKYYVTMNVLDHNQSHNSSSSSANNGSEHQSAFVPVSKKEDTPMITNDEKREMLDQIVKALGSTLEQLPITWLNSAYEKSVELKCECDSILSSYITQAILNSAVLDEGIENIPDDVMARLLERVNKHKEEHIKDPQLLLKLSSLIDSYVEQLRQRGTLTSEQFVRLATCIPKEQRTSHDSLLLALDDILKDEKSTKLSDDERGELLSQIDFSRVNEETITACKSNKLIPQQLITEAALALCAKLRNQLDETQQRLHLAENELLKSRPTYISSIYRSRHYESPSRRVARSRTPLINSYDLPISSSTRSRTTYINSYDLPLTSSTYDYSKYDIDTDLDHMLPSRYLSSSLSSRYGTYSSYH